MFFAVSFDIFIPMKNARVPEIIIVIIISVKFCAVTVFRMVFIVAAAPERVLLREKRVMKDRAMTIVLIEPTRKRNSLGFFSVFPENSDARTAACPEPIPGRKEHKGAVSVEAMDDFRICFLLSESFVFVIFCFINIFDEVFSETIRAEVPNNPVSNGRRGSLTGRFRVVYPINPARINIVRESRNSSSLRMR